MCTENTHLSVDVTKKMKMKKKYYALALAIGLTLIPLSINAVDIYYQMSKIEGAQAVIKNNRTLVPLRVISEELGCEVNWNAKTQTATVKNYNSDTIFFVIGESAMTIKREGKSAEKEQIDTPAEIINGKTYVPLRAAADALGLVTEWNEKNSSVELGIMDGSAEDIENEKKNKNFSDVTVNSADIDLIKDAYNVGMPDITANNCPSIFYKTDLSMMKLEKIDYFPYALNERIPARYLTYKADISDAEDVFFFINPENKKVYMQTQMSMPEGGVTYSMPEFKCVVPPAFGGDFLFYSALLKQKNPNYTYNGLSYEEQTIMEGDFLTGFDVKIYDNDNKKGKPALNIKIMPYELTVTDKDTGEKLFDNSKLAQYPEKNITEQNAASEAVKILEKYKRIPAGKNYTAKNIYQFGGIFSDYRNGFSMDLYDGNILVGTYFINMSGTVVMEKIKVDDNLNDDMFLYVYGAHTPFG